MYEKHYGKFDAAAKIRYLALFRYGIRNSHYNYLEYYKTYGENKRSFLMYNAMEDSLRIKTNQCL